MNYMYPIYLLIGYLLGSIPFALIIGKVFYKTDIRQFGSGNLGGTNAGRVLGKKAGAAVIFLDVMKAVLAIYIVSLFDKEASIWTGLAVCIGHCYPIFANFKGGKAVSNMFGFLVAVSLFTVNNIWCLLIPFACFILCLYLSKMVSLSSMVAAVASTLCMILFKMNSSIITASFLMSALIIYRHRSNIVKIKNGTENKIKWL